MGATAARGAIEIHKGIGSAPQAITYVKARNAGQPLTRAEALRQASLAVMRDSAKDAAGKPLFSYAHPVFWAPYALVGDGGR